MRNQASVKCAMCGKDLSSEMVEVSQTGGLDLCEDCMEVMLYNQVWA
jgi:ribosome-binding protein aMBF1 (putative translation factor)